ncbi:hypothetical protein Tco_1379003 [Tanacetum coccineum]
MKPWVDIIRENAICLGGHRDHVFACLCHMLYCIETSTPYNLAFFILKRMEKTRNKPKELLPYGMLLTRLFKHVVSVFSELAIDHYLSHDRVQGSFNNDCTGRYAQWHHGLTDTIDYKEQKVMPTEVHSHSNPRVTHQLFTATEDSPEIQLKTTVGQSAQEMWEAIERILQGESLNIQDVKTIFILGVWSIPRLTIGERDIEALYTRFYKMMNEMIRNNFDSCYDAS